MPDNDLQAYVQDDDENEDPIEPYTSSAPPSVKEEANVSRTRNRDKLRREQAGSGSASPIVDLIDDSESDSATRARRSPTKREAKRPKENKDKDKDKDKERKKEKMEGKRKSVTYEQSRPHTGRAKTTPNLNIHTSPATSRRQPEFAPSPVITAAATDSRPRAYTAQGTLPYGRPVSYSASPGGTVSRPPLSNLRHYQQPPSPLPPYPLQSPMFFQQPFTAPPHSGHYPPPHAFHAPAFQPSPAFGYPQSDYFGPGRQIVPRPDVGPGRPMGPRPDYQRPHSAMGYHQPVISLANHHYEDDYEDGGPPTRRSSLKQRPSIRQQEGEDRKRMPPPPQPRNRRPSTTAATQSPFPLPRPNRHSIESVDSIRSIDYVDDDSQWSDNDHIHDDYRPHTVRRPKIDNVAYDAESHYARYPDRRRRNSHHRPLSRDMERQTEDKYQSAQQFAERYQENHQGPTNTLTVDTLNKLARTPSQRTKSTGSRGNDDAQHILIRGTTRLTIGDLSISMDAEDGAEIRIPATISGGNGGSRGGGSNDSDTSYDDRRTDFNNGRADERGRHTRADRQQIRSGRATSRATSHSRGLPPSGYYIPAPVTEYGGSVYHHYPQAPAYAPHSGLPYPTRP